MIAGLDHVQLACPAGSEDRLRGFYVGVLGMSEIPKPPRLQARGGVWFRSGTWSLRLRHGGCIERQPGVAGSQCRFSSLPMQLLSVPSRMRVHFETSPIGVPVFAALLASFRTQASYLMTHASFWEAQAFWGVLPVGLTSRTISWTLSIPLPDCG